MNCHDILDEMLKEVPDLLPGGRHGQLARAAERSPIFRQIVEACATVAHKQSVRQGIRMRTALMMEAIIERAQPREDCDEPH